MRSAAALRPALPPLLLAGFLFVPGAAPASAQTESCPGGRISYVLVDNHSIFDESDTSLDDRFRWAYRAANKLHIRTREGVILRELLFAPGECYDPVAMAETERILRAYNFLAGVEIFGVPQPDSTWHVVVDTQDEWSTRVELRFGGKSGAAIEGVRINEVNVAGSGQSVGMYYIDRNVTRDYGASYFTPQLLGTRWDLRTSLGRSRAGTLVHAEVAYPFVGEVSRWAGRQSFAREDRFFDYILGDAQVDRDHVLLPMRESFFDFAVVRRIGSRVAMTLLGGGISYHKIGYPGFPHFVPLGRFEDRSPADTSLLRQLVAQRHPVDNIRLSFLLGQRNIWYATRHGMDSMRGEEDVPLGAEVALSVGRSLPALETDDDFVTALDLYTGFDIGDLLVIGRGRAESRRDLRASVGTPEWKDVYGDAELLAYLRTEALSNHTFLLRGSLVGAWNATTPFQLTLGGPRALRGYDRERFPGARRAVVTVEDRIFLGWPLPDVMDMGLSVFADAGRVWPGDVPFGEDSGLRVSAGFGLRNSFPAGGRNTLRLDFAWPVDSGFDFNDARLIFSVGEFLGLSADVGDPQVLRSRRSAVAGGLFSPRY